MKPQPISSLPSIEDSRLGTIKNFRIGFFLFALVIIILGTSFSWRSWQAEKRYEAVYLTSMAQITSNTLDSYFYRYEMILARLSENIVQRNIETQYLQIHALLTEVAEESPDVKRLVLTRSDGQIIMANDISPGTEITFNTDSPSFRASLNDFKLGYPMSIGRAAKSVIDGEWNIYLRYAMRDSNRNLLYVLTITLPVKAQQQFWDTVALPTGSSIGLLRDDDYVISRYPAPSTMGYEELYGKPRNGALVEYLHTNSFPASGLVEGYNSVAKTDYEWAFDRLEKYPLTVYVATPTATILSKWEDQAQLSLGLVSLLLIGGYLAYRWSIARQFAWEQRIQFLAYHDALTELPNRLKSKDRLDQDIALANRNGSKVALIFIDLDNFKSINDTMGHSVGDVLLKETAVKLRDIIRATDTLCRLGGDEFLILLGDISEPEMITRVSEEVLQRLSEPCQIAGRDLYSTVSMGIAIYPEDGKNFETLLKAADTAMYQAKASGRATYRFYAEKMNQEAEQWQQIRNWLRQALDEDGFKLHYQPKISLVDGRLIGAEALLRLHLSDGTLLPPTEFIPIAEESGLILPIGAWVLRQACLDAARWRNEGATDFVIAVNISAPQFHRGDLVEQVVNALTDSGLPPEGLELELTESLLIENNDLILQTITQLSAMGVSFAIDDFGTGYSSLSYLKKFDIDFLKIDQSFTRNLAFGSSDMALSEAIIVMAHKLGLKVTAEGVETELQKELLATAGCDYAQGYLFSRPIPPEEFANLLGGNTGSS